MESQYQIESKKNINNEQDRAFYSQTNKTYLIRNVEIGIGYLTYTEKESSSGYYIQNLTGSNYEQDKKYYEPDNKWRNSVLWEIIPAPDDEGNYFFLVNKSLDFGFLSYAFEKSPTGYYAQHLFGGNYDYEKKFYEKGEKYRNSILWKIEKENEGFYSIKNKDFEKEDSGFLCYTSKKSNSGHYGQVLCGERFQNKQINYEKGGKWRYSILWEIKIGEKK